MPESRQIATLSATAPLTYAVPQPSDQVDVLAGGDQQRLECERRQPAVEHVRDPAARLAGAFRQVEEARRMALAAHRRRSVQSQRSVLHHPSW
jgi:hypothetical protein